jgi:hypothetical protein
MLMMLMLTYTHNTMHNAYNIAALLAKCAFAPPASIAYITTKTTAHFYKNTKHICKLIILCWLTNILFTIRVLLHLIKHTWKHIKYLQRTTFSIIIAIISMTAAIVTNISPIIYTDDTQPEMLAENVGGNILQTYTRNKHACDNNNTLWFCAVNWIPFIFNTITPTQQEEDDSDRLQNNPFDHLPPLQEGEDWMIADSGANRHYHRHNRFLFRREQMRNAIGGMTGSNQATTDEFGIFACTLTDDEEINHPITSVAYSVPNAQVSLFSEIQCCFAGNTVLHRGHPETGQHGIILKGSNIFIPYHFDRQTLLFWVKVKPPRASHCAHAREMNPRNYMNP